jgi:hypothetical protein
MYLGGHSRFALACAILARGAYVVCAVCVWGLRACRAGCSQDRLDISRARANAPVTVVSSMPEHSTQAGPEHSTKAGPEHSNSLISDDPLVIRPHAISIHDPSRAWQQAAASGSMQAGHRHALSRLARLLYNTTTHMFDRNWRLLQKRTANCPTTDFIENYYWPNHTTGKECTNKWSATYGLLSISPVSSTQRSHTTVVLLCLLFRLSNVPGLTAQLCLLNSVYCAYRVRWEAGAAWG